MLFQFSSSFLKSAKMDGSSFAIELVIFEHANMNDRRASFSYEMVHLLPDHI